MEEIYPVFRDDIKVGEARIIKEGLFYNIYCQCALPTNTLCSLYAESGLKHIRLGIPVPDRKYYTLRTHVPSYQLPTEDLRFYVKLNGKTMGIDCVLELGQKVACLSKLEAAYFCKNGSRCGLNFKKIES